jgi:hypothetical protein
LIFRSKTRAAIENDPCSEHDHAATHSPKKSQAKKLRSSQIRPDEHNIVHMITNKIASQLFLAHATESNKRDRIPDDNEHEGISILVVRKQTNPNKKSDFLSSAHVTPPA